MPRPRPPHLQRRITRHFAWYVRRGRGPCIRIRGAYGSPEFEVPASINRRPERSYGLLSDIRNPPCGRDFRRRLKASARTSTSVFARRREKSRIRPSPKRPSSRAETGGNQRPSRETLIRGSLAYRNAGAACFRYPALHRASARRCSGARPSAKTLQASYSAWP
jgi:hypothetical protein